MWLITFKKILSRLPGNIDGAETVLILVANNQFEINEIDAMLLSLDKKYFPPYLCSTSIPV